MQSINHTMHITDLGFDCLESCLQYLDIADLLNIADCNKQLRHAARYLIGRDIKRVEVKLNLNDRMFRNPNRKFVLDKNTFSFGRDLKFCLQFFRCCGDLVSRMVIMSSYQQRSSVVCDHDQFINYVNEYCSASVIKMKFRLCRGETLRSLTKPFRKVKQIEIIDSRLTDMKLSELFPNLRTIKFTWRYCTPEPVPFPKYFFTDHYPRLEHMSIFVDVRKKCCKNVSNFLRTHPQLRTFSGNISLQTIFDGKKIFPYASEFLQNLEELVLGEIDCSNTTDETIHLKNLKELSIFLRATRESMWTFPFLCNQLESLKITVFPENGENFLSRITNYPKNLKKIIIDSSSINHMEISKVLPLLEEIDLTSYVYYFTVDEVVRFVSEFRSLKLLRFRSPEISIEVLAARFGNAWSVSFEDRSSVVAALENRKFLYIKVERYAG